MANGITPSHPNSKVDEVIYARALSGSCKYRTSDKSGLLEIEQLDGGIVKAGYEIMNDNLRITFNKGSPILDGHQVLGSKNDKVPEAIILNKQ
jgi:hypothetical protein